MKNIQYNYLLLLFSFMLLTSANCKKEVTVPVPKLPDETQIGVATFE